MLPNITTNDISESYQITSLLQFNDIKKIQAY